MDTTNLTKGERELGAPIRSLRDREAYVALGQSNADPDSTDGETLTLALEATVAAVADTATDEDRARILAWVREGERSERAEEMRCHCGEVLGERCACEWVPDSEAEIVEYVPDYQQGSHIAAGYDGVAAVPRGAAKRARIARQCVEHVVGHWVRVAR